MVVAALVFAIALPSLTAEDARHLLARTGFGPSRREIEELMPLDRARAVEALVDGLRTEAATEPPAFESVLPLRKPKTATEKREKGMRKLEESFALKSWWANEMMSTTSPFTEHLVLFWSNHFTSSLQKVKVPELLYQQNLLYRREGAGSFRTLLTDVVDDRAMLLYLDGAKNKAGEPNENFARELLELFTLGEGHYTEADVQAAARALTGTTISPRTGVAVAPWFRHDRGNKTFLGVTGHLDKTDVVDILLEQPRVSELIVEKLWREFVSPDPDARAVARLAADFRASDYALKPLLKALLMSDAFWSAQNRGTLTKSPVDLVIGGARSLDLVADHNPDPSPEWVASTLRTLGQDLFDPPNVKGWPGGDRWVTTLTLPDRERLAREAVRASALREDTRVPLATLLLPLPAVEGDATLEGIARDPAFQLK